MSNRPEIPKDTIVELMIKSAHRCCIQHEAFTDNSPIDIHHIDGEPTNNQINNLVPVCKNCHHSKIHNNPSFSHHYSKDEIIKIRDGWYKLVEEQRKEAAKNAIQDEHLLFEENDESGLFKFNANFENSEILYGKKSRIILAFTNNTNYDMRLISYQFLINYLFENTLIPRLTYQKRIWDFEPSIIKKQSNGKKELGKVNPSSYYFMSHNCGVWVIHINVEYTYNEKNIFVVESEASITIT